ncbi:MAG: TIR domain-containing protein [Desulfobacterales bacterium]|nr:TIR domain-containing protein [Desulfobacterales bacterium]
MNSKTSPKTVFLSYARQDRICAKQLYEDITKAGISVWWDEESLLAGQEREFEIRKAIKNCSYFITLLSRHSVSEQGIIQKEQKYAINCADERPHGDIFIIPAKIEPCESSYETHHKLVWVNLFPEYKSGIRKILEVLKPEKEIPLEILNPYRGLEAFREQDSPYYFGRDAVIRNLQNTVQKQPFVAVIGASGSGKSSLVFAGSTPCLKNPSESSSGKEWIIASFRPKNQPFNNLALALIPLLYKDKLEQAEQLTKFAEKLDKGNIGLSQVVQLIIQEHVGKRFLLIADQFEELYTLNPDKDLQRRFADALLKGLSANDFTLLLTMRADFMGQAIAYTPFAEALNVYKPVILPPMKETELRLAIEKPAEKLGVRLEPGLADLILKDLGNEPGNLPLLEFALTQLWERQTFRQLTHEAYKNIGGVNQALARYADEVYAEFTEEEQKQIRQIFVQLVNPGQGTEDTRQVATFEQIKEENRILVAKLADKRLIITGRNEETKQESVEVVHEALIRYWQPLKNWMDEDREFRTWQNNIRQLIREWEQTGKDDGALLRGAKLADAEENIKKYEGVLTELEKVYIKNSISLRENEIADKERQRRKLEYLLNKSESNELIALIESSHALFLSNNELESLIAGIKAAKKSKKLNISKELKNKIICNLRDIVNNIQEIYRLEGHSKYVFSVDFRPDGEILASGSEDGTVKFWQIRNGKEVGRIKTGYPITSVNYSLKKNFFAFGRKDGIVNLYNLKSDANSELQKHSKDVYCVSFNRNGTILATSGGDKSICLWDTQNKNEIFTLSCDSDEVRCVDFGPDGKILASGTNDNKIILWSIEDRTEIRTLVGHSKGVFCLEFSPNGKILASGSIDKTIILWDIATKKEVKRLKGHSDSVWSLNFSHDGKILASGSFDKTIKLWNIETGTEIKTIKGHTHPVWNVKFSPDNEILASGSFDNSIRIWKVADNNILVNILKGHEDTIRWANFSPDDEMVASGSSDKNIILWDLTKGYQQPVKTVLKGHSNYVYYVDFNPDGKILISGSKDTTVKLWDVNKRKEILTLNAHNSTVYCVKFNPCNGKIFATGSTDNTIKIWEIQNRKISLNCVWKIKFSKFGKMDFSPDGRILSSGCGDGTIRLLDIQKRRELKPLKGHSLSVYCVKFSHDGKFLFSGSRDNTVIIWNTGDWNTKSILKGHSHSVASLDVTRNGNFLASGSWDHTIKLWKVEDGIEINALQRHTEGVHSVNFSSNNDNLLISGSADKTIGLWDLRNITNMDLDNLLLQGAKWINGHLKYNPNVNEEDRALCDDILSEPQIHTD